VADLRGMQAGQSIGRDASLMLPLSSSRCLLEGETTGFAPRPLKEVQTPMCDTLSALNARRRIDPRFALVTGNRWTETLHRSRSGHQRSMHHWFLCPMSELHSLPYSRRGRGLSRSSCPASAFSSIASQFSGCRWFLVAPFGDKGDKEDEGLQMHTYKFTFG
jgi:hypothetical protein